MPPAEVASTLKVFRIDALRLRLLGAKESLAATRLNELERTEKKVDSMGG
jgi:hypothetical protein